jgi:hypothetical protein
VTEASSESAGVPGRGHGRRPRLRHGWVLLPIVLFFVYSASFSGYPVVEENVSAVGEADAASYSRIFRDFTLRHQFGNPYNLKGRTTADVAQKHKIHHVLSAALGRVLYEGFRPLYRLAGLPPTRAVYSVDAFWTCLNVVLLAFLLRGANPNGNPVLPFLLFYGVSLAPWLYGSVPDSWPLTATLFLTFLLLLRSGRVPLSALCVVLGVMMLNNMALGALLLPLFLRLWREEPLGIRSVSRAAALGTVTVGVWLASLSLLSLFDPMFRPDRFWAFSRWFRQFMHADLPLTSLYVWKSSLSNLFVNSVVTNQSDPNIAQEAMLITLRTSRLGAVAIAAVVTLLGLGLVRAVRYAAAVWRPEHALRAVLTDPDLLPVIWCGVMIAVTLALFYGGGFTYAALVVPMLAGILCRHLDLRVVAQRLLVYSAIGLVLVNNIDQVLQFRATLAAAR